MATINPETRTSIFFHLSYIIAVPFVSDGAADVRFQQALLDNGLEFSQVNKRQGGIGLVRMQPSPLQVKLEAPAAQLSSLSVSSQNPAYDLDMFIRDVEAVCGAYQKVFSSGQFQLIRVTGKIHHLYSCSVHPFQYIWEERLGQKGDDLKCLGGVPVAGGGFRLLMPPHSKEGQEPRSSEIRIESFLHEPGKILAETVFTWPQPRIIAKDGNFEPGRHLKPLEEYASNEVLAFLTMRREV